MIEAAILSLRDIFTPPFRSVLFKSLALTLTLLAALWILLERVIAYLVELPYPWLDTAFAVATGAGLVIGLGFFVAPVTSLFAGLFLDDIAEVVEQTRYPQDPSGHNMPIGRSLLATIKFTGVVLLVNMIALPLVFFLGFGFLIFLVANAYLLGREYFEMASYRHHDEATTQALRTRHSGRVFLAGLMVAGLLAIPFLNLLTPLFATALMVHVFKQVEKAERRPGGLLGR
jgi:CysZ protein